MNEVLKQRLVGALILIALGVVFWPIIFVEPGDNAEAEGRRIPARPAVNTTPLAAPDREGLRDSPALASRKDAEEQELARESAAQSPAQEVEPVKAAPVQKPPEKASEPVAVTPAAKPQEQQKTRTTAPKKPAIDSEGVPVAWILQVASVSKPDKAEELRRRLLAMGYKAYTKKVYRSDTVLLRVYIGPKFERAQLEKIKRSVDSEFGVKSLVVRYIP
ncbi:MAG: SPOR domain-containing protein [Halioglobus sp.]